MAGTTIADVVKFNRFLDYVQQATMEKTALYRSGVVRVDPRITERINAVGVGGTKIEMPFWGDLIGDDEVLSESEISIDKITAGKDVAPIIRRAKGWSATDLAADLAGSDPVTAIVNRIADFRARKRQQTILAVLAGVFAANAADSNGDLILDISQETGDDAFLNKDTLLFAAQLLGDAKGKLTTIAMHSQAETLLNVIGSGSDLYKAADKPGELASYNGKAIISDDTVRYDPTTGIADIYLFAEGAVGLTPAVEQTPFETDRNAGKSMNALYSRDAYIAHIGGFAWQEATMTGASASNEELALAANWKRVFEKKAIRVCLLRCKITDGIEIIDGGDGGDGGDNPPAGGDNPPAGGDDPPAGGDETGGGGDETGGGGE